MPRGGKTVHYFCKVTRRTLAFFVSLCYDNRGALHRVLPPTADGCLRQEVMRMGCVTYEALFAFVLMLCAIISLVQNQRNR